MGVHTRNVGNYSGAIKDAALKLVSFSAVAGLAVTVMNKLKDAFLDTEQGALFQSRITQVTKTFFQNVIRNTKDYWKAFFSNDIEEAGGVQKRTFLQLASADEIAKKWDELRKGDRKDVVEIQRIEGELNRLRLQGADVSKSISEQLQFQELASKKEEELIKYKLADKQEEFIVKKKVYLKHKGLIKALNKDDPMRIAEELRNGKYHTVWGGVSQSLSQISKQDPYTQMMYELMRKNIQIYTDSDGNTVLVDHGRKRVIKK